MKNLLAPFLLLVLFACEGNQKAKNWNKRVDTPTAVESTTADSPQSNVRNKVQNEILPGANTPLAYIRQKVEAINKTQLTPKHFELMCDEKILVDYFYTNKQLIKIHVDYGTIGDVYAREDYYYDNEKLIFVYEYVKGGPACDGCIKTNEYRSYIKNNKVIKYLKDKNPDNCRKCEFGPASKQYKLLTAQTPAQIKSVLCR